ncbi:hypothetical protein [Agrobacterium pusense]|uniref:hypothetical protein n=1 Tax=Agrobacterium pusense TaxID=648995 RepID=UPI000D3C1A59|nr:hypothetical protein [Agrobacterium pusense]PTV70243.1 hypothetical protein DBL06_25605 [Agrobacterium pusense]
MKTIALRTVAPSYGFDGKLSGFHTKINATYPFNANGLVMAIANAKKIFAQGYACGLELAFSYFETDEHKMPMANLFSLIDLSPRDLARYASMEIRDEETRRIEEGTTAMVATAISMMLITFPEGVISVGQGGPASKDLGKLLKEYEKLAELEEYVSIIVTDDNDDILGCLNTRPSGSKISDFDIIDAWTTNLEPAIKLANEVREAFEHPETYEGFAQIAA